MKRGRPTKGEDRRDYTLRMRLAPPERELFEALAREDGEEVSTWIRNKLLEIAEARTMQETRNA